LILVRLLLFLSLAAIAVAAVMYLFSKDRRYVRFIWHVLKFTIVILAVVLIFFAFERLVGPML
jgi:integral membrane sensor domain MASE1